MCGIVALASIKSSLNDTEIVGVSLERVKHRGPDERFAETVSVECTGSGIVLGHARLAVVGNANALQPLHWAKDGSVFHLVVNGEIYNFRELKEHLVLDGLCRVDEFQTDGDSEVLLACLVHQGLSWTLKNIRGMFAFILVESSKSDERIQTITLCRDVFGIKPLCYAVDQSNQRIFISSEMAAIPESFGAADVKDVLPSTYVEIIYRTAGETSYWSLDENIYESRSRFTSKVNLLSHKRNELAQLIRPKLVDAVSVRIPKNDVRWGVLLSGGLDSSLIAAIAADAVHPSPIHSFTVTFSDNSAGSQPVDDGDKKYARIVANSRPNIIHEDVVFSFQDALDVLPAVVNAVETTDVAVVRASIPLYVLSKHISSKHFKVMLCGEGADESLAGYRLFEEYDPNSNDDCTKFANELERRLVNIDTSELQRVDRCTSAHGLEARVPFMDLSFVDTVMGIDYKEKMSHPSQGKIQKYILRHAFDNYLPDLVIYREKEQFADGIGSSWVNKLRSYAASICSDIDAAETPETALYRMHLHAKHKPEQQRKFDKLIEDRKARRRANAYAGKVSTPGTSQPPRWHEVRNDPELQKLNLSVDEAHSFLRNILGWSKEDIQSLSHNIESLDKLIVSMLSRVPFHNLTLLTRERRPPTMDEIKRDMMTGLGGPCSVVNSFFALLLDKLGFGPYVYLLSCRINGRNDCHVAILLQMKGLRYFVDVANAKPYTCAVQLADTAIRTCLDDSFLWNLEYCPESKMMQVHHRSGSDAGKEASVAVEFHPACTVQYRSFREMIKRSRSDASFGPFLTGMRMCLYPRDASKIIAVRDACIYDGGSMSCKQCALSKDDLISISKREEFAHIRGFDGLVQKAIDVLDREHPGWFDDSLDVLKSKGIQLFTGREREGGIQ